MLLTPLQLCLLCSDLPPLQQPQLKGFLFSSVVLQSHIQALHFIRNQFESNYWGKKTHTKKLRDSLQFQLWLLHTSSVGVQPKTQRTSLLQDSFGTKATVGTASEAGNLTGERAVFGKTVQNNLLCQEGINNSNVWPTLAVSPTIIAYTGLPFFDFPLSQVVSLHWDYTQFS